MKFQILCEDLGFEDMPGNNTWKLDGRSVSAAGRRSEKAEKAAVREWNECAVPAPCGVPS